MDYKDKNNQESTISASEAPGRKSIANNFQYHRPGEEIERKHETVRSILGSVARDMDRILPPGRESALVQTKLEEAMFWANAAIARNQ